MMIQTNYANEQNTNRTKDLIFELSSNINSLSSAEEVITFCLKEFIPHFKLDDFVLYKYCAGSLRKCATLNQPLFLNHEVKNPLVLTPGNGIVGQTALHKSTHLVNDTEKNINYIVDDERRHSELSTPVLFKNKLIGVMDSENKEKDFYTLELKQVFETLSMIIAPYLKEINLRVKENNYLIRFRTMLDDDRVYLEKNLSQESVADQLNITPGHLSALIHQNGLESFRLFVNKYRIRHFLELSKSNSAISNSVLSMAYSSGFASKATFNRAFKKQMGVSPLKYLKGVEAGH